MDEAKNQINDLGHKETKNNQAEEQEEKNPPKIRIELRSLWDNFKWTIHFIAVAEGEKKEQEIATLFGKIMKENFPELVKEIDMQVQEAQSPKQDGYEDVHTEAHHN